MLLACAAARGGEERARGIAEAIARGIDWPYLVRTARAHGLVPLLHWHLEAAGYGGVPGDVAAALRQEFRTIAWKNVLLLGEMLRVLRLLASHQVRAIPFKGPALAATVYGNVALRQFGDIDLVVRARDRVRGREVLCANGFDLFAEWTQVQQFNHEYTLIARGDRVRVDVHWEVFPRSVFPIDADGLWQRATPTEIGGQQVTVFSPEDTLLILCVHADTHLWERLQWICDIARLLDAHPALDWGEVLRRARESGSERILLLGLRLATDLLRAGVPEDVGRRARGDAAVAMLAAEVTARLFRDAPTEAVTLDLEKSIFQLRSRPRLWDKIRLVATPNETDWALLPLPRPLYPLYFVLRPFRLLLKYGAGRLRR